LFGGGRIGSQITGGMQIGGLANADNGPYNLNNGYASPTASVTGLTISVIGSGTYGGQIVASTQGGAHAADADLITVAKFDQLLRYDNDIPSGSKVCIASVPTLSLTNAGVNMDNLVACTASVGAGQQQRRLTRIDPDDTSQVLIVTAVASGSATTMQLSTSLAAVTVMSCPMKDSFVAGDALGSVKGSTTLGGWDLENNKDLPEIDIRVDSVAVTAVTKKLKAKWSPELGQDLNAYHNLDAEVELTSILSEQIALEIDQEILEDLMIGATGATQYWSRSPGKFVNRDTGVEVGVGVTPDFTGTVSEWYETLIETINGVSAQIHRKTVRGGANFLVCGPEVAGVLEFTAGFRANVTVDSNKGSAGAMNVGSISKKFDIYVDPYFPRNVVLVGRKGSSFLESGYVYAPYVPLQVTPTIFGTEDFVPRKGVMTRYAKKMVRPDMYGLVIVEDLV
jgi:hypothetical protein